MEKHNVANQAFGLSHVGQPKVDALASIIKNETGLGVTTHNERVSQNVPMGPFVFLLTDTMSSRKEIFQNCIQFNPYVNLMIETRMGTYEGRIYAIQPKNLNHSREWLKNWYPDPEVNESVCRGATTIGATADILSGYTVTTFMRYVKDPSSVGNELMFTSDPPSIFERKFED